MHRRDYDSPWNVKLNKKKNRGNWQWNNGLNKKWSGSSKEFWTVFGEKILKGVWTGEREDDVKVRVCGKFKTKILEVKWLLIKIK